LAAGLAEIRKQFQVPAEFPAEVAAAAKSAAQRSPTAHVDRTDWGFVTLDPAMSTDLDQAFFLESRGNDILLHYAIADVAWFVDDGDPLDVEAWRRGMTQYLPDGRASLYPPVLSEAAASLLPDGPRPAVIFYVLVDQVGAARLDGAERAIIRSRAKLAYETVTDDDVPPEFGELSRRINAASEQRGATRIEPVEQEVSARPEGGFELTLRANLASEERNAAMSLATNLAIADAMLRANAGLFRTMDGPDDRAIRRLRHTAHAFGIEWPKQVDLATFERGLHTDNPRHAAMVLAIRRAGGRAAYQPLHLMPGSTASPPWHAAMAATYAHATAPLRRLADRYVVQAALALGSGQPIPDAVVEAFERLPEPMARAESLGHNIDRAVVDLAEAAVLHGREGDTFAAVVTDTDERGARIQLTDLPIVARVDAKSVQPGDHLRVKLIEANTATRSITFSRVA